MIHRAVVLVGTETGNAEDLAGELAVTLEGAGVETEVVDMEDADPGLLNGSRAVSVLKASRKKGEDIHQAGRKSFDRTPRDGDPMRDRDMHPRQQNHRHAEERIADIRRELAVGEACAGTEPETWKVVEEELLDELTELEISLLKGASDPYVLRTLPAGRGK